MQEVVIPKRLSGQRLDAILAELFPQHSKSALQKLVRRGGVQVDGKRTLRSNIRPGRRALLRLSFGSRKSPETRFEFGVVHEDEAILVLNKPAGLLSHRKSTGSEEALAELVAERYGRLPLLMGEERPGIVHRLDRETSGLIVLARTANAMENLREQFRARAVQKTYGALSHGVPSESLLDLDWDVGPAVGRPDRQSHFPRGEAKPARTEVRLLEAFESCSWLACLPKTGRRHQIRVHLHAAGLPIVGDKIYGAKSAPGLAPGAPHPLFHCLHATRLGFLHPTTGEAVEFECEPRSELVELLDWMRTRSSPSQG